MIQNINLFFKKAFQFARQYDYVAYLDTNFYTDNLIGNRFEKILAFGAKKVFTHKTSNAFENFKNFTKHNKDWYFGFFTYDLKNELENLKSENDDKLGFPDLFFFVPEIIVIEKNNKIEIFSENLDNDVLIDRINKENLEPINQLNINLIEKVPKNEYLKNIQQIQNHIYLGDIYEMNFCVEYYNDNVQLDAFSLYQKLKDISPAPFSSFLKFKNKYLISSSPERYLSKRGQKVYSQPIKGTISRGITDKEDIKNKELLKNSQKDIAENVMIVDLVRNDLSRIAKKATVKVDELCEIYSYPTVFQMISTVSATIDNEYDFLDTIKVSFPPGSMTGAPKIRAMKLIEQYESTKRGLYSGVLGYITPEKDFDFNVVIRSLLYNEGNRYLSAMVGGAITAQSDAEAEYYECRLKAKALIESLKN